MDNPFDVRRREGKEHGEDKVKDDSLENFLDAGAESKESSTEGKSERRKTEGMGTLRKYEGLRML